MIFLFEFVIVQDSSYIFVFAHYFNKYLDCLPVSLRTVQNAHIFENH